MKIKHYKSEYSSTVSYDNRGMGIIRYMDYLNYTVLNNGEFYSLFTIPLEGESFITNEKIFIRR